MRKMFKITKFCMEFNLCKSGMAYGSAIFKASIFTLGALAFLGHSQALCALENAPKQNGQKQKFYEFPDDAAPQIMREATWLWPDKCEYDNYNLYSQFKKAFELESVPEKVVFHISADQSYRLWINGRFVCSGPARGYQESWPFDSFDIAPYLKKGKNLIAIRVYSPGRSSFQHLEKTSAGVIFACEINGQKIISDDSVDKRLQSGVARDTVPLTLQIPGFQEAIDLRVEDCDWFNSYEKFEFQAGIQSKYTKKPYNSIPYYKYEERGIPMLEEEILPLNLKLVGKSVGDAKLPSEGDIKNPRRNLTKVFEAEGMEHEPLAAGENDDASTISVLPTQKGKFRSFLIDFGRVNIGVPIIEIEGAKGGEIIDMQFAEFVFEKNSFGKTSHLNSRVCLANSLICGDKKFQSHQFHHPLGFRYMILRVRENSSEIKISTKLRSYMYPFKDRGKFESSEELANKIWSVSKHTQRICSLDAYVDTPFREQAQWWGDARVQAWNTFFIDPDPRLLRRGISIIARQRTLDGLTFGHAPTMAPNCVLPDFSAIWLITLYDYWWQTGDTEAYETHIDTVNSIISYFDKAANPETGLIRYDPRYWLFLDWTKIQKEGEPALLSMWLLYAYDRLAELCSSKESLRQHAEWYRARAEKMRAAVEKNLLDTDGLVRDGILPDGTVNSHKSLQAQVLGKMCNLKGLDFEKAKREIIIPYLLGEKTMDSDPSSYWVVYALKVMIDEGEEKAVYDYIMRNWKSMAEFGSTFEVFKMRHAASSLSHAWSAHPVFLLPQILGGVKQTAPAWKKVSVNPTYIGDWAKITFPTPNGDIKVEWKKLPNGSVEKKIDLPPTIEQ